MTNSFKNVPEVLAKAIRKEKQINGLQMREQKCELPRFVVNVILYVRNQKMQPRDD